MSPYSVPSYNTQRDAEDLFLPGPHGIVVVVVVAKRQEKDYFCSTR
jgi:hypothetical protein